ncbi:hypothetical protein AB4Y37_41755, partial [Paraburkholderia caribensis]
MVAVFVFVVGRGCWVVLVFSLVSAICFCFCFCFCWYPRYGFALASAICFRASRVAPVRGGTYFSLPPQRKVGKRKRLTPPILDL